MSPFASHTLRISLRVLSYSGKILLKRQKSLESPHGERSGALVFGQKRAIGTLSAGPLAPSLSLVIINASRLSAKSDDATLRLAEYVFEST